MIVARGPLAVRHRSPASFRGTLTMAAVTGLAMYDDAQKAGNEIRIEDHASLVKRIAYHMMLRMPASVQVDDLIQAGMIGLLEAAQKYDGSRGASFETYAGIRIRGAIVDEMRRGDWAPRSVHRNARRVAQAMAAVEARTGRDAQDAEVEIGRASCRGRGWWWERGGQL